MKKSKSHTKTGRIYKTMAACAAGERTPIEVVKWAKDEGCEAFRANGNVNADEFRAWIKANADRAPKGESLKDQKLREEVRKLRVRNDTEEGFLIKALPQYEFSEAFAAKIMDTAKQVFVNETPALSAGQDAIAISIINENAINSRFVPLIHEYLSSQPARIIFEKRNRDTGETEPGDQENRQEADL